MDQAQSIKLKLWNDQTLALNISVQDRIRIKNVRVKDFHNMNTLNSTDETVVEVSRSFTIVRFLLIILTKKLT